MFSSIRAICFPSLMKLLKAGLLEQLEKAVVEAILKESGEKEIRPEDITEEKLTNIVKSVGNKKTEDSGEEAEKIQNAQEIPESGIPDQLDEIKETAAEEKVRLLKQKK